MCAGYIIDPKISRGFLFCQVSVLLLLAAAGRAYAVAYVLFLFGDRSYSLSLRLGVGAGGYQACEGGKLGEVTQITPSRPLLIVGDGVCQNARLPLMYVLDKSVSTATGGMGCCADKFPFASRDGL